MSEMIDEKVRTGGSWVITIAVSGSLVALLILNGISYDTMGQKILYFLLDAVILSLLSAVLWMVCLKRINGLNENIRTVTDEIIKTAEDIPLTKNKKRSKKRSAHHHTLSSAMTVIKESIEKSRSDYQDKVVNMRALLSDIFIENDDILANASQLTELNQRYYQSTFKQSSALSQISEDMNSFADQIKDIAGNTTRANEFAVEMNRATDTGSQKMDEMMGSISEISESSQKVSKIIQTIDEIASKTNLLSLNATIEANRAGIHGRTFAVVAQEVRDLAIQSRDAVKQTTDLVNATLSDLASGTQISDNALKALLAIKNEVEKVTDITLKISESANYQAESVTRFKQNIAEIAQLTRLQEENSKITASVSDELSRYAEKVKGRLLEAETGYAESRDGFLEKASQLDVQKLDRPFRFYFDPFAPLTFTEGGQPRGFFVDLIKETIGRRMNIDLEFAEFDWDICQDKVFEGEGDGLITVPTPERLEMLETNVRAAYPFSWVLWTYSDHPRIEQIQNIRTIEDIKSGGFSVITYKGNGWVKSNVESLGIPVSYVDEEFRYLVNKEKDLSIEEPLVGVEKIKQWGINRDVIIQTEVVLYTAPFQLLISKRSPYRSLLKAFDRKLKEIRADGTYDRLIAPYQ